MNGPEVNFVVVDVIDSFVAVDVKVNGVIFVIIVIVFFGCCCCCCIILMQDIMTTTARE